MSAVERPGPEEGHSTHRLLGEEIIRSRYPEAADYILAVRAEVVARYGEVDTWSRFAAAIKAERSSRLPNTRHDRRALARRRGEHFNSPNGPPWKTVEEVLRLAVDRDRVDECRQRFITLYTAARGEPPPSAERPAPPNPGVPRQAGAPEVETNQSAALDSDLVPEMVHLQSELANARNLVERYEVHLRQARAHMAGLEARLASSRAEANGLRAELAAVRVRQASGKGGPQAMTGQWPERPRTLFNGPVQPERPSSSSGAWQPPGAASPSFSRLNRPGGAATGRASVPGGPPPADPLADPISPALGSQGTPREPGNHTGGSWPAPTGPEWSLHAPTVELPLIPRQIDRSPSPTDQNLNRTEPRPEWDGATAALPDEAEEGEAHE